MPSSIRPLLGSGAAADKERLDATPDGGSFRMDANAGEIAEVSYGGPNSLAAQFAIHMKQLCDDVSGSISTLAGQNSGANTATEANIDMAGANSTLDAYRMKVTRWWAKIMEAIAWFSFNDVLNEPTIERQHGEMLRTVRTWTYEERQKINFFDFMFDILPSSNVFQTPEQKAAALSRLIGQAFMPFAQLALQQGVTLDIGKYVSRVAAMSDLEQEVKELMMRSDIPDPQNQPGSGNGPIAVTSNKPNGNYVHTSRPSTMTRRGQENVLQSNLLGSARQGKEQTWALG